MPNPLSGNINSTQFNSPQTQQPVQTGGITPQMRENAVHVKNIMNMLKSSGNPQAMLQQVAQKNPQLNQVMQLCSGRNPEQVFREMCRQQNINPDEFIKMFQ